MDAGGEELLESVGFQYSLFLGNFMTVNNKFFVMCKPRTDLCDRFSEMEIEGCSKQLEVLWKN